jgi:Flp pilus assembly protein TadD
MKKYQEAINEVNQELALNHFNPRLYNMRAIARAGLGNYDLAIVDFDKAIELDPNEKVIK